jgi:hypothetical protein
LLLLLLLLALMLLGGEGLEQRGGRGKVLV